MNVEEAAGLWDGLVDFATASDLQAKRMRVLQLHVDELKRQAHAREGENRQLLEKVSEHARQQKEKKPQERRLFARLEHMQAEVLTLREQRTVAEAHARELQAQLEKVVDAAEADRRRQRAGGYEEGVSRRTLAFDASPRVARFVQLRMSKPAADAAAFALRNMLVLGPRAADEAEASACVAGYVLGLDITERDEQTAAKNAGMPWSVSKGYDSFLPPSAPFELAPGEDWRRLRLWLDVNGERRQACECGAMIHSVEKLICYVSSIMTLEPGDLLLTGTPKGVGRLAAGDRVTAGVAGKVELQRVANDLTLLIDTANAPIFASMPRAR